MLQLLGIAHGSSKLHSIRLLSGKACVIIVAAGMSIFSGCDPVRTTNHNVRITVVDDRGLPAPNVRVSIKESWESWQSWEPGGVAESDKSFFRQRWESDFVPWREGLTNAEGKAVIKAVVSSLDGSRGSGEAPTNRNVFLNREYIIKLQTPDAEDELLVVLRPGTVSSGKWYTVKIDAIENPKYVQGF